MIFKLLSFRRKKTSPISGEKAESFLRALDVFESNTHYWGRWSALAEFMVTSPVSAQDVTRLYDDVCPEYRKNSSKRLSVLLAAAEVERMRPYLLAELFEASLVGDQLDPREALHRKFTSMVRAAMCV